MSDYLDRIQKLADAIEQRTLRAEDVPVHDRFAVQEELVVRFLVRLSKRPPPPPPGKVGRPKKYPRRGKW